MTAGKDVRHYPIGEADVLKVDKEKDQKNAPEGGRAHRTWALRLHVCDVSFLLQARPCGRFIM